MLKNGLFLCSIGFLIIVYAMNPMTASYDFLSLTTGITLVCVGGYFYFKGKKKEEKKTKEAKK
ncbi:DUF3188 domain-containing protein [Enterococcus sp. HY326]|uniref:DUF3188 domain-containing protein n=1 Tax=Enterococcus sp. HY326 TaxID=2971265 RepID=UPI00223EA2EA|nr:DUF3188 domain-containing protein [Enterococcus sp. HY326]